MQLSTAFAIDPKAPWVRRHNDEARAVLAAWRADRPIRVPVLCDDSFFQHGLYAGQVGLDYQRYYTDPAEMLRVQLEAARYRREAPIADMILGEAPEVWPLTVDFWPVPVPGWLGCEIVIRSTYVPAYRSLHLDREACEAMPMPDPRAGGILPRIAAFQREMAALAEGLTFLGRPVGPVQHGVDHYGVFAMALDVRGPEIMADMYEEPAFAHHFLLQMAEWCDALEQAWRDMSHRPYFRNTDHGIDMLSPSIYERFLVPVILEMNRRRGTALPTGLHYCGRGTHLFPTIARTFPLQRLDDVTHPMVDIARARAIVGDAVWMKVQVDEAILKVGPPDRIRDAVQALLTPEVKGRGRLAISVGDMLPDVPLAHRLALYEAVREFGAYE